MVIQQLQFTFDYYRMNVEDAVFAQLQPGICRITIARLSGRSASEDRKNHYGGEAGNGDNKLQNVARELCTKGKRSLN